VNNILPDKLTCGATLRDNEYAWSVASFPAALKAAPALGYGCLGGQFQYREDNGSIYELFWLDADASERFPDEVWDSYTVRSCGEVLEGFERRLRETNFREQVQQYSIQDSATTKNLVFNAYFITEVEFDRITESGVEI